MLPRSVLQAPSVLWPERSGTWPSTDRKEGIPLFGDPQNIRKNHPKISPNLFASLEDMQPQKLVCPTMVHSLHSDSLLWNVFSTTNVVVEIQYVVDFASCSCLRTVLGHHIQPPSSHLTKRTRLEIPKDGGKKLNGFQCPLSSHYTGLLTRIPMMNDQ